VSEKRLVYSTDSGRVQPAPSSSKPKAANPSKPKAANASVPEDGVVRLFRERGNRGGKVVTVIRGLPQRGPALEALASEMRKLCGAGGTVREDAVEIQGDHRERLAERLRALGYQVKLAGG
jgi:translation initiation factor 1